MRGSVVPGPVEALVVPAGNRGDGRQRVAAREDALAVVRVQADALLLRRTQRCRLLPRARGHADPPEVMQQCRESHVVLLTLVEPERLRSLRDQPLDPGRVPKCERGLEVGDVRESARDLFNLARSHPTPRAWLPGDRRLERVARVEVREQASAALRERGHDLGIEPAASTLSHAADRGGSAFERVERDGSRGHGGQARGERNVVALAADRPLAVPALEGLADRALHSVGQSEAPRGHRGDFADGALDVAAPADSADRIRDDARTLARRTVRANRGKQRQHFPRTALVGSGEQRARRQLVAAEVRGLLVRRGRAAEVLQQRRVVHVCDRGLGQREPAREAGRHEAGTGRLLVRRAHAEVGDQRERHQQLG